MKLIIAVALCCVALLPSIFPKAHSDEDKESKFNKFYTYLKENAAKGRNGELINGILRLSKNGFLGRGGFGLTYKAKFEGEMELNGKEVALKFTPVEDKEAAAREYAIYEYLLAVDNPISESLGVPVVYYYERFRDYIVMAVTLLQPTFNQLCRNHELTILDVLITFREFVKMTKYIHHCGIRHDDIKSDNMMYAGHRLFIIDYNLAQKMNDSCQGGTPDYYSRRVHLGQQPCAKDDWESFLYSACQMINYDLGWFGRDLYPAAIYQFKKNTTLIKETINRMPCPILRKVIYRFAEYIFDDDKELSPGYPHYDGFYKYIEKRIEKHTTERPALVSWLTPVEKKNAIYELKYIESVNIFSVPQPIPSVTFPVVRPRYFRLKYHAADPTKKLRRLNTFGPNVPASQWM